MEERQLTEKESLEVITALIARTKERYIGDGSIMLLWGYLVWIVSLAVWIMLITTGQKIWNILWFAIPLVGGIATPIMVRKHERHKGFKTFTDKFTSRLWRFAGLTELLVLCNCISTQYITGASCWGALLAYTLIALPIVEITQGLLIKEKCLRYGGIVGLSAGITMASCVAGGIAPRSNWYIPLLILAFVGMMVVPGHILHNRAQKEK